MAEVINGTSGNDRLAAISETSVKAGAGNDTINVAGAKNVTIETGSGKDEIVFPYEGYDNPSVTFTDFDTQNDVLNFPEWAFFYKNYYFRASIENGNLVLKDGLDYYTLTFQGVTSTDEIKGTVVKKWDGYSGKLGGILYNTISGSSSGDTKQSSDNVIYLTSSNDSTLTNPLTNVKIEALAGNDSIEFHGNNITVNGDQGDDTITGGGYPTTTHYYHIGKNVYVHGGVGNDFISLVGIENSLIDAGEGDDTISVRSYNSSSYVNITHVPADKVTITGGKGNDSIQIYGENNSFVYNSGDGDDTIEGFNATSTLSISGDSYSSVTSGNDVIITVGDGSITLKDAKDTSLNIIGTYTSDTTSPDNPPDDDGDTTSAYDKNTKTLRIYNGYGNEAKASDYGDEVKNISAITRTKPIKITGNELDNLINGGSANDELIGGDGSDTIHGNDGKDTLYGSAGDDVLYGDEGNDEIHGDSGDDELYGGVGNDILFGSDGKNTLNGGKDSDTLVGGKGEDLFVHSNGGGDDLILEYNFDQGDKLKFENELIEDVKIEGSDVIITAENGEKLTLKYAAGKKISYINMRGNTETIDRNGNKPKSADSIYVKATRLMDSANRTVDSTKSSAANTLYDSAKTKAEAEADFSVTELKKNIKLYSLRGGTVKVSDIPNSVYEKISEELLSAFNGSMIDHYEYGDMGSKLIKQIANQIKNGFIDSTTVVTDKKTKIAYTISNSTRAMSGAEIAFVKVSWSNKEVILTWTNVNKESGQIGLANYLKNLSDLNKDVWKDFVAAWLSPVTGKNTRAALDFAERVIEALCYKDDSKAKVLVNEIGENYLDELKSDLNERFTNSAQKLVRKFISEYIPKGDKILDAVDKIKATRSAYDELKEKYTSLVEAIEDYNDLANTGDFLALEKDYNTVENLYNKFNSAITDGINTDDTILDKIFEALNSVLGISKANAAEKIVTDLDSLDDLTNNGTSILTFTENSGSGIQNVNLRSSEYPQVVSLEGGNQEVQFNDKNGNVAIVGASATGSKNIIFGNGDDLGIFLSSKANINTTLGSGRDSVLVDNNARVRVDMTNADNAKIIPYSGKVILDGYDASTRSAVIMPDVDDIADAVKNKTIQVVDDVLKINSAASVEFSDSSTNAQFVNLIDADGRRNIFGWSKASGGVLDGNGIDRGQILHSSGDSTIRGGAKNDIIFAGDDDVLSVSGGRDELHLEHNYNGVVTIDMGKGSEHARTEIVEDFKVTNDVIKIDDTDDLKVRIRDDKLTFRKGNALLTFDELTSFDDANGLQVEVGDETYTLRSDYSGGLTSSNYWWSDDNNRYYKPDTSLYVVDGGAEREYHIGEGSGRATIDGFNFGMFGDVLFLDKAAALSYQGDDLAIVNVSNDRVAIINGAGKVLNVVIDGKHYLAEVGANLTYKNDVDYYGDLSGDKGSTVSVGEDYVYNQVAVYMNGANELGGKVKNYVGVDKIDASAFGGQASLIGGDLNDTIIAAQGATSLWGGDGGNDVLIGTGTGNEFFYFKGNGNDIIQNAADGDIVNLYDVTLYDISSTQINSAGAIVEFKDGGSVTFLGTADATFKLGDGSSWKANHQFNEWNSQA